MSGNTNSFGSGSVPPGSMDQTDYDANLNLIVDLAENASQLGGQSLTNVLNRANHTGTQLAATISDFATAVDNSASVNALQASSHTQGSDTVLDDGGANETHAVDIRAHLDATSANPHGVAFSNLVAGTLAQLNAAVSDADLDDVSGTRDPNPHNHATSDVNSGTFADARIAASNVTQHVAAIDHNALLNYNVAEHRTINDAGTSTIDLLSASKILDLVAAASSGLDIHAPVDTVALTDITLSGEQIIGGVLTSGSRVAVVGQTASEDNGIYITAAGAWTRSSDANEDSEFEHGMSFHVLGGDNLGDEFVLITPNPITLGVTGLDYVQIPRIEIGTTAGTACEGNDARIPLQDENDALQGTSGTPSNANRYVTNSDTRLHVQNSDTLLDEGNVNEVSAADLRTHLDATSANPHGVTFSNLVAGTLAQLNAAISDANVDDAGTARPPTAHASSHIYGASDEIDADQAGINLVPVNYAPDIAPAMVSDTHHLSAHLAGIDNVLADAHEQNTDTSLDLGGANPITAATIKTHVDIVSGNPHGVSLGNIVAGTLAELNTAISDANVDDAGDPRTPTSHAASHIRGGSDEIDGDILDIDFTPSNYTRDPSAPASNNEHLSAHLRGIDNALSGISFPLVDTTALVRDPIDGTKRVRIDAGLVATATTRVVTVPNADIEVDDKNSPRTPTAHASSHNDGGSDELTVQSLGSGGLPSSHTISSNGTGGWNTTKFNPLFGTEYHYAESLAPSVYTGTALLDKLSTTTPSVPAGTYRIEWSFNFNISTATSFIGGVYVDGTLIHNIAQEPQEHDNLPAPYNVAPWGSPAGLGGGTASHQRFTETGFSNITFGSAATHTFIIRWAGSTAGPDTIIWNAKLAMWRIS